MLLVLYRKNIIEVEFFTFYIKYRPITKLIMKKIRFHVTLLVVLESEDNRVFFASKVVNKLLKNFFFFSFKLILCSIKKKS